MPGQQFEKANWCQSVEVAAFLLPIKPFEEIRRGLEKRTEIFLNRTHIPRNIREIPTTPISVLEGQHSVEFDQTVEVRKSQVPREEIRHQLYHLGEENPDSEIHEVGLAAEITLVQCIGQNGVVEQGKIDKRGQVDGVDAPGLTAPDGSIGE